MPLFTKSAVSLGLMLIFMLAGSFPLPAAAQGVGQVMMEKPPAAEDK